MKNGFVFHSVTKSLLMISLLFASSLLAKSHWSDYSKNALDSAGDKIVLLGFHKKGCGTCVKQDKELSKSFESAKINPKDEFIFLNVERKDKKLNEVYEQYGFNKNQWAAIVALKNGKEIARIEPGTTDANKINDFVAKLK